MAITSRRRQRHPPLLFLLLLFLLIGTAPAFLSPSPSSRPRSSSQHASRARPPAATTVGAMEVVNVELGDRSYPIYIGPGLLTKGDAPLLTKHITGKRALVVTNDVRDFGGGRGVCAFVCTGTLFGSNTYRDQLKKPTNPARIDQKKARGPAVPVDDQQGARRRAAHCEGRGGAARRGGVQGKKRGLCWGRAIYGRLSS